MDNDRNESFRITKDWVMKVAEKRLTDRDRNLLDIVRRHKLVDRDQLIKLVGLTHLSQSVQILNKRLKILYRHYFLDRSYPHITRGKGAIPYIYALDRSSSYFYDIRPWRRNIKHIKDLNGDIFKRLPINYLHNLIINDIVSTILEVCEEFGWGLVYYGVEEENIMNITYKDKNAIVPDIIVIIQNKSLEARAFFMEVDLGNEGKDILKTKISHYNMLKTYRAWINEKWYKTYIEPHMHGGVVFPQIMFLMGNSSVSRNKMIKDAALHYKLVCTVIPLTKFRKWISSIFD